MPNLLLARRLLLVLLLAIASCGGQSTPEGKQSSSTVSDLPIHPVPFKPGLSMIEGLKVADRYTEREHIDISKYWLSEARFIVYGDKGKNTKGIPSWYFLWQNSNGTTGDYVEVIVSMDGKAMRVPSM